MKKLIYIIIIGILLGCSPSKKDLFEVTDSFVESLQTTYEGYGILDAEDQMKLTADGYYQVLPVGRLINVKILKDVSHDTYIRLEEDLKSHYKNDGRVNDVFISGSGTIMIDCRN